ncbi:hypothetical protein BD311DRAFT_666225 [Dichomitus squalens]|uniref:RING-type E3 ubiquitin transferase n=1 Tax=Dichomitus squalens TaxID=114155 RepID=A0A4Q9MJG8_9APHY|nr:hypothetical protein BD311DRAFT_666225 [Dichomitus squalens]
MLGRRASTPDNTADLSREISSSEHPESLLDASDDPLVAQRNASATSSEAHAHPGGESDSRPRPLSPGSIDVLGTLLSVAAAATAASLFSPNLGFQADRHSDPPSLAGIPRPMSPTPTAGLSGGEGLASLAGLGLDHPPPISPPSTAVAQQREGRDRIRNVWDSFRDRLGLNRNASGSRSDDDSASSSEGQGNMRPGEIMLAEMARALNVGLGLNSDDSGTAGTDEPAATSTAREAPHVADDVSQGRPVPPEDSFERFLLNLQADLRTALSDDSGVTLTTPAGNGTDQSGDDVAISRRHLFNELPVGVVDTEDQVEDDEPPPLEDVADSDGEDDNSDDGQTSTRTPTPMPSAHPVTHGPRDQISLEAAEQEDASNADQGRPGINLWRLYRFQPIPANQVAGHASASTSSPLAQSPAPSHLPSTPISAASHPFSPTDSLLSSVSPVPSASTPNSAGPAQVATPPAEDGTSAMVVPVIVVGLQSVEMGQVQGRGRPVTEVGEPDFGETERRSPLFDNVRPAAPLDESNTTTTRGRSWQSRAATALRNLRPGRRNNSGGGRSADGAGSRTFLIYVIGGDIGYYPPNHHMVTGSDNLDSYEALWELAELLGQVKPPVATREDIDNSGLQIIKATELDQFEQQGKVASNCVERCLICLDDYSPEEDLRLMTCKHVFHRDCVDKWLQVGRNNCPACRTKVRSQSSIRFANRD